MYLSLQEDPFFKKYRKLNEAMVGIITDYSLVTFIALHAEVSYSFYTLL